MYARQINPVRFVGRRRQSVGAEFYTCPDGTVVKNGSWNCPGANGGGASVPTNTGGWGPGPIPTNTGGWSPGVPPNIQDLIPRLTPTPTPITTPIPTSVPTSVPTPIPTPIPSNPGQPQIPGCRPICNPCPENQKRYYMPFVPQAGYTASVTAGSTVIFVGRPQKLFAPDRLIIGSTIGAYFDVVSLTIGNIPQSLSAGNVGAEMFSEVATYVMMTFDQAYPGIDIILTAQNKSSVTQTFQAQLIGEAVG